MTLTVQHREQRIKVNKAQCLKCGDIIESAHRHDFRGCSCRSLYVDGGREYLRRVGYPEHMKELSEYEEA